MPRYFEVIGATAKLAREKIKQQFGNLSIVKEEEVLSPEWKWFGKWLGLKKKSYYRIIVSEYKVSKPFLTTQSSKSEDPSVLGSPLEQANNLYRSKNHTDSKDAPKRSSKISPKISSTASKNTHTRRHTHRNKIVPQEADLKLFAAISENNADNSRREQDSKHDSKHHSTKHHSDLPSSKMPASSLLKQPYQRTSIQAEAPSERNLMEKSLKNFFRSVVQLHQQQNDKEQKQSEAYTLFDYPLAQSTPNNTLNPSHPLPSMPNDHSSSENIDASNNSSKGSSAHSEVLAKALSLVEAKKTQFPASAHTSNTSNTSNVAHAAHTLDMPHLVNRVHPAFSEEPLHASESSFLPHNEPSHNEPSHIKYAKQARKTQAVTHARNLKALRKVAKVGENYKRKKVPAKRLPNAINTVNIVNTANNTSRSMPKDTSKNVASAMARSEMRPQVAIETLPQRVSQVNLPPRQAVEDFLVEKDFSAKIIAEVIEMSYLRTLQSEEDKQILAETLATLISYDGELEYDVKQDEAKLVFMAGSTGVGKTTTLSKLAFQYSNVKKASISVASYDLRRMAAFEQLKSFSDIIKVPLRKLEHKRSLLELYQQNRQTNLIFIDTPGCSVREEELIEEVASMMYYLNAPKSIYWCVPAASRTRDLLFAQKSFNLQQGTSLIFTKVDESTSLGSVLSLAYHSKFPVSYLCTGQDILNDFEVASLEVMQQRLMREWASPRTP